MGFFRQLFHRSADSTTAEIEQLSDIGNIEINPATGLPMIGEGIGGVDVAGNPWGTDFSEDSSSGIDPGFDCFTDEF